MVQLTTTDGVTLEAEVSVPAGAGAGVVLCHPHPQYGGDMHAPLIAALFERLVRSGVAALRFDFRGVGRSGGTHDEGRGERLDVVAAVAHLVGVVDGPVIVAGWSFGADVSLAVDDPAIAGWCAIAPPLRLVPADQMVAGADPRPKVVAVPQHDQLNPPDRARPLLDGWKATRVEVIPGADHFLTGRADRVAALCLELVEAVAS
jgi:alpha/beta superfamily hydrolase